MKTLEAKSDKELTEIRRKIELARAWARRHFNADRCNDTRLIDENLNTLPPSFFVEFPSPDTMRISPSIMGISGLWIEYRLYFRSDGSIVWRGKNPFWGTPLPLLVVSQEAKT